MAFLKNSNYRIFKVLVLCMMTFCTSVTSAQGPPDGGTNTEDTFPHQLKVSLYESTTFTNDGDAADSVVIAFDAQGNNNLDDDDVLNNDIPNENVAILNNGVYLSIEKRNIPLDQEHVQLDISTYLSTNYVLIVEGIDMPGATPYLYDAYTDSYVEVLQDGTVEYPYSINSNIPTTEASDRFSIVFGNASLSISNNSLQQIKLYPNPTTIGKFYLDVPVSMDNLEVTIYSTLGVKLYNEEGIIGGNSVAIETDKLFILGTYFVELSSNGKTITKKLIIN
jgi:hypothetical protein